MINLGLSRRSNILFVNNLYEGNHMSIMFCKLFETGTVFRALNNTFRNNAGTRGGVYQFSSSVASFFFSGNSYINNSAEMGGVGAIEFSTISFSEVGNIYQGNSATTYGGVWLLDVSQRSTLYFMNSSYVGNSAKSGGVLYTLQVAAVFSGCNFRVFSR